jgi:hypothetical protein
VEHVIARLMCAKKGRYYQRCANESDALAGVLQVKVGTLVWALGRPVCGLEEDPPRRLGGGCSHEACVGGGADMCPKPRFIRDARL